MEAAHPAPLSLQNAVFVEFASDSDVKIGLLKLEDGNVLEFIPVPSIVLRLESPSDKPVYMHQASCLMRLKRLGEPYQDSLFIPAGTAPDPARGRPVPFEFAGDPLVYLLQLSDGNLLEVTTAIDQITFYGRDHSNGLPFYLARTRQFLRSYPGSPQGTPDPHRRLI